MSSTTSAITDTSLRRWNAVLGLLHLAQAIAMVALSTAIALPVTAAFGTGPPGQPMSPVELEELFSYRLGYAVALFSLLSAVFHAIVASPWGWPRYLNELAHERNRFRWVEYSLSASLMIVLVAGITGITDIAALIALFALNASMILFGWLQETTSARRGEGVSFTPFVFGSIAGAVPWIAIAIYLIGAGSDVPGFVYGIYGSLLVFFNCFAITQLLQYRARGRWADYRVGERSYMVLSLLAKSALAWQIFANVLI